MKSMYMGEIKYDKPNFPYNKDLSQREDVQF